MAIVADDYKVLTFAFGSAGAQSWTADRDYFLTAAVQNTATQAVMFSTDPISTVALITGTTRLITAVLVIIFNSRAPITNLQVPIIRDKTYYARSDGVATLQLYLVPQNLDFLLT